MFNISGCHSAGYRRLCLRIINIGKRAFLCTCAGRFLLVFLYICDVGRGARRRWWQYIYIRSKNREKAEGESGKRLKPPGYVGIMEVRKGCDGGEPLGRTSGCGILRFALAGETSSGGSRRPSGGVALRCLRFSPQEAPFRTVGRAKADGLQ